MIKEYKWVIIWATAWVIGGAIKLYLDYKERKKAKTIPIPLPPGPNDDPIPPMTGPNDG